MIPTIFERFRESVKTRKKAKKVVDGAMSLSGNTDEEDKIRLSSGYSIEIEKPVRLLDEGALTWDDGNIRFYIEKGTMKRFYDELDDDFVGYINVGHFSLTSFPYVIGTWQKSDLSLVDIGEGRQAIEVIPHLNEEMSLVKDLLSQEIPLSVSVEAYFGHNYEMTEKLGFPVVNSVFIDGFSVVGNPGNTASMDVLSDMGELMNKEKLEEKTEKIEEEQFIENAQEQTVDKEEEHQEQVALEEETQGEESLSSEDEENTEDAVSLEEEEDESEKKLLDVIEELVKENKELKERLEALESDREKRSRKTESVLAKLESIVNDSPAKDSHRQDKDSVWG